MIAGSQARVAAILCALALALAPQQVLAQPDPHLHQKLIPAPYPDRAEPRPGLDVPTRVRPPRPFRSEVPVWRPRRHMHQKLIPEPFPPNVRPLTSAPPAAPGFTMTERGRAGDAVSAEPIAKARDLPAQLAACFRPPDELAKRVNEVTVRLAFSASGEVIGAPRITYTNLALDDPRRAVLVAAFLKGIADCAPLRFTPAMASAIAGRIFTIRYVIAPPGEL